MYHLVQHSAITEGMFFVQLVKGKYLSGSDGAFIYTTDMMQPYSPSVSPDDDVFQHLATVYASTHPTMHMGQPCNSMDMGFKGGISNGAAWYPLTGE